MARIVTTSNRVVRRLIAEQLDHFFHLEIIGIEFVERRGDLNAELRPIVERVCSDDGYTPPILCTPDELMGGGLRRSSRQSGRRTPKVSATRGFVEGAR